jgi:hypothetical protein
MTKERRFDPHFPDSRDSILNVVLTFPAQPPWTPNWLHRLTYLTLEQRRSGQLDL